MLSKTTSNFDLLNKSVRGSLAANKTKRNNTGASWRRNVSHTVRDGRVDGIGESAHVRVGGWDAPCAADAPRHDAREIRSAAWRAGHRAAAVARTRVRVARRAGAQHRRIHHVALLVDRAETRAEVYDAHSGVEQHTGRAASWARTWTYSYVCVSRRTKRVCLCGGRFALSCSVLRSAHSRF